jgi:hypothetical protein
MLQSSPVIRRLYSLIAGTTLTCRDDVPVTSMSGKDDGSPNWDSRSQGELILVRQMLRMPKHKRLRWVCDSRLMIDAARIQAAAGEPALISTVSRRTPVNVDLQMEYR